MVRNVFHEDWLHVICIVVVVVVCSDAIWKSRSWPTMIHAYLGQDITWTNADLLSVGCIGTNFRDIWIQIQRFSLKEISLKMFLKCPPFSHRLKQITSKKTFLAISMFAANLSDRTVSQIPQCTSLISHNAPFCNRNVHMCAHFCYKMVHCGMSDRCIFSICETIFINIGQ